MIWRSAGFWRGFSAVATAVAAALLVLLLESQPRTLAIPSSVAVLNDLDAKPSFLVRADYKSHAVTVEPLREHHKPETVDYELWAVPKTKGVPPVSLGVITVEKKQSIALTEKQFETVKQAISMAVSMEPLGGSPTGAPTGEVRFQGAVVASAHH